MKFSDLFFLIAAFLSLSMSSPPSGQAQAVVKLTNNSVMAGAPLVSGETVVWFEISLDEEETEVLKLWDGLTTRQISANPPTNISQLEASGGNVIWTQSIDVNDYDPAYPIRNYELFLWDGLSTQKIADIVDKPSCCSGVSLALAGQRISWSAYDGDDYEIYPVTAPPRDLT